jgi:hypothetical protein
MTNSTKAVQLHHRRALGEELTKEEHELLEAWYAEGDATEAAALRLESEPGELVHVLKKQIGEMLQQISASVQRLQQLTAENEVLKQENEQLKRLLAQRAQQLPA